VTEERPNRIFAECVNRSGDRFRDIKAPGLLDLPDEIKITGFSLRGFRRKDDPDQ
jgi:hypothetical protein